MLADTVPFPAYWRETVRRAGPYDEELVRNQDDEYNYRLRKLGAKILLAADVQIRLLQPEHIPIALEAVLPVRVLEGEGDAEAPPSNERAAVRSGLVCCRRISVSAYWGGFCGPGGLFWSFRHVFDRRARSRLLPPPGCGQTKYFPLILVFHFRFFISDMEVASWSD